MNKKITNFLTLRQWLVLIGIFLLCGTGHQALSRLFTCECSYNDGGVKVEIGYTVNADSRGGCCTGATGIGLMVKTQPSGKVDGGYIEGGLAQSLCCGDVY